MYERKYKNIVVGQPAETLGVTGDPKREAGAKKLSYMNRSLVARALVNYVMEGGADEYGAYNWAQHSMKASTYYSAISRHLDLWLGGQDNDTKSGVNHLAHVIASCEILIEQQHLGKLIDDRPKDLADLAKVLGALAMKKKLDK